MRSMCLSQYLQQPTVVIAFLGGNAHPSGLFGSHMPMSFTDFGLDYGSPDFTNYALPEHTGVAQTA